jgi:MFS transporter, ACS family, glucarate transporter
MRYRVVGMTALLAAITYLDRAAIGVVSGDIRRDMDLSLSQMAYVFSAFTIAYAAFEVPTAIWADRVGARGVVARIVAWWSAFTIATASAFNYTSLLVIRFLFGVGEAGAWPCVGRVYSRWIPAGERGRVQGIFFAAAHLAGAITPMLVLFLMRFMPWRGVFVVFGILGMVWAVAWLRWFRDEPRDMPGIDPAEAGFIEKERGLAHGSHGDWRRVFQLDSIWPLCLSHAANSYGTYFIITWLPEYLTNVRGMTKAQMGIFAGLPLFLAAVADLLGGVTTDALTKRYGRSVGRAGVAAFAYIVSAVAMYGAAVLPDAQQAATCIAISYGMSMFTLGAVFSFCIELGKENSAVVTATMNTAGQIAGTLSPIVLAKLVEYFANWALPFYVMAVFYLIAFLCWLQIGWRIRQPQASKT